ncbi:AAA family ATPase [uncultured Anaerococcus sp.]|uniref:AAA family ATPase n=1 Tax=uncultured Anaerococcus sp. TaxID=293428 RepID=UPI00288A1AF0|nr:AAA family ATPase [uncultured Anaerococcus sp.]
MKLYMENIGKLANTEIAIDGITVIAGKNGTGKSTVSKSLYSIFSSFYDYNEKINALRNNLLKNELRRPTTSFFMRRFDTEALDLFLHYLYQNRMSFKENKNALKDSIIKFVSENFSDDYDDFEDSNRLQDGLSEDILDGIIRALFISDDELLRFIVDRTFDIEFNSQVKNIRSEKKTAKINLSIKDKNIYLNFDIDGNLNIENPFPLTKKIVYIDDPYIVDKVHVPAYFRSSRSILNRNIYLGHYDDLIELLRKEKSAESILVDDRLKIIDDHIRKAGDINIFQERDKYSYSFNQGEERVNIKNASTGLKTFLIIKLLLDNGSLEENGTIILDEPETHLHPDWQIILAELIVLFNRYLGMHILINSHSPYFIRAIEVYSAKHKVYDICKYYLSKNNENTGLSEIKDVSNNVEEIYSVLSVAFDTLEYESLL